MYGATLAQARPWIAGFEERLEAMLAGVRTAFPGGCHIFLANIYDPSDGTGSLWVAGLPAWPDGLVILAAYNDVIARAAATHADVHMVDMHALFLGHGLACRRFWSRHYCSADPTYWYSIVEDPNDRGYDALRRAFLNEMVSALATGAAD